MFEGRSNANFTGSSINPNLGNIIVCHPIDFEFLETDNFHAVFRLREDKESDLILAEILEIHFINMVKWRKYSTIDIANEPLHPQTRRVLAAKN